MKLFYSSTSPYARKVQMLAMELGIDAQLEQCELHPLKNARELATVNPLGKVPALVTPKGGLVVDSPVICAWLDNHAVQLGKKTLLGESRERQQQIRELEALADGIMDPAFLLVMEAARPQQQQSTQWRQRWRDAIHRTLDYLDKERCRELSSGATVTLAELAMACALGYLDFRHTDMNWREGRADLSGWFDAIQQRHSFHATLPPGAS
ncbi:MAG: glutathione S-transferase N-terminal domain-containing protein [Pseudomonadales bacterium]|nr:glutathione S-transferase N-terminal domain-containing protein [Pseudomonadales bacterium]